MSQTPTSPRCEICGAPARVHVSNQLPGKGKVMRRFCMDCADTRQEDVFPEEETSAPPLSRAAVYIVAGSFVALLSITADWVRPGAREGFGVYQTAALILSAVLFFAGAVLRTATLVVAAVLMGGLSLFADRIKLGQVRGFGLYQEFGTLLGLLLAGYGIALACRRKRSTG